MFTVRRLGVGGNLAGTLTTTNCIESMISIARRSTARVTRWKDGTTKKRWIAVGMLEAERSFHRIEGYKVRHGQARKGASPPGHHRHWYTHQLRSDSGLNQL
ncbi:MAG: hypothetical protein ACYCS7_14340 [Acidimicrobiales bacterium]